MDDFVKRLRSVPPCIGCGEYPGGDIAQIMDIAAARIAHLEAQVAAADALAAVLDEPLQSYPKRSTYEYRWEAVDDALAAYNEAKKGGA